MADGRVYGRNPVLELLRGGSRRTDEIAVLAGARGPLQEIVALARRSGVKVSFRTRDQLTAMAGSPYHQGAVARVAEAEYVDFGDLLEIPARRGEPALFLALDQVQDPRNLGALLRTADVLGVHGVVVPKHRTAGLTDATARTAMGALEFVRVAREANLPHVLEVMKNMGIWVYGTAATGPTPVWKADLTGPVCLVLGNEGQGLRPVVEAACDAVLAIPVLGHIASLNVGAAGAVCCYEAVRQRTENTRKPR